MENEQRVNMREVAKQAGVSAPVVSAVLLGDRARARTVRFSPATAERVTQVANELGYIPNRLTRSVVHREPFALAAIAPWPHHDRYSDILRALALHCRNDDLHLLVEPSTFEHADILERLRDLAALQIGAVALIPSASQEVVAESVIQQHREHREICPHLCCVDWFFDEVVYDCVTIDERLSMALPLRHLAERGHRRIALLGTATERRLRLLREEARTLGLEDSLERMEEGLVADRNIDECDIPELARRLLRRKPRPTAIYCLRDSYALITFGICEREFGLRVGTDVALIGQDDTPMAQWLPTPLTSLNHRNAEAAAALYQLMIGRMRKNKLPPKPICHMIEPELIVRASSAQPAPTT